MYKNMMKSLRGWNATHSERSKLQHAYISLAVISIIAAGLIGLVNYDLGQRLTTIALIVLGVFFINLVAWTLLSGLVLSSLETPRKQTRATATAAKTTAAKAKKKK